MGDDIHIVIRYCNNIIEWYMRCVINLVYKPLYYYRQKAKIIKPTENLGRLGFGIHKHHRSHCSSAAQKMCWPRVPSHETDTFDFNTHYY